MMLSSNVRFTAMYMYFEIAAATTNPLPALR